MHFIKSFNKPTDKNQLIDEWITKHNNSLNSKKPTPYLNNIKTKDKALDQKLNKILTWDKLLTDTTINHDKYYCGTIHSAKGRTFNAVLLILTSTNKNILKKDLIKNEELRNVYVGMSRARYVLHIVVPKKDVGYWNDFFETTQTTLFEFE